MRPDLGEVDHADLEFAVGGLQFSHLAGMDLLHGIGRQHGESAGRDFDKLHRPGSTRRSSIWPLCRDAGTA